MIDELLLRLGGTSPMDGNPTPGFTPATRRQGFAALGAFTPTTYDERTLIERCEPLFTPGFTALDHRRFRAALYEVYREQGFTPAELASYFPDLTKA